MGLKLVGMAFRISAGMIFAGALGAGIVAAQQTPPQQTPPQTRGSKATGNEGWQIEQRRRWWIESRGLDKVRAAGQKRRGAVRTLRAQIARQASTSRAAGEVWRELGPSSMRMGDWTMGRVSGRINAITPHPTNDSIVYIGSANGGVWKSIDAGTSWTPTFADVGSQSIGALFVEPGNPQNVWAGTGDRNDGDCAGYLSEGVFLSSDGGNTWAARNNGMALSVVTSMTTLPTNANVVLAAGFGERCNSGGDANGGIYRSTDHGATWTQVMDRKVEDIVTVPGTSTVYASAPGSAVYRSSDGGSTWTPMGVANTSSRLRLALSPSNPAVIYALSSTTLYRSDNAGDSWNLVSSTACDGQCSYNLALAVHPTNPMTVLVGAIRPRRSTDGGVKFNTLTSAWGSSQQVHQDTHVVRYSLNDPNRIWVGSDGGVWRSDNSASSWVNMNANLNITQYYDIVVHPTDPNIVFGGAQDNSSSKRTASNVWDLTFVNGDGFMNAIDDLNAAIVFQNGYPNITATIPAIYRSTQSGAPDTFASAGSSGLTGGGFPWVTPTDIAGGYHFVGGYYVSRAPTSAGSMSWTTVSPRVNGTVRVITAKKIGSNVAVYAGTTAGSIYYSANAASSNVADVTGNYPGDSVADIAIDPTNPSRVFVACAAFGGAKLYVSTAGGTSWTSIGGGLPDVPANTVAIDPLNLQRIFVGTDIGVYESTDSGASFVPMSTGLPSGLVVSDLEVDNSPHTLSAGTYGRGAWQVDLRSVNVPPVANFTFATSALTASFTDTSTDSDGTIASRSWNFGDSTASTATNPSKTYAAAGTYTVTLTVTDNGGATHIRTSSVTVTAGGGGTVLSNGVAVTGLTATTGNSLNYTMLVPAGTSNLVFTTSGGTGDVDMYVKLGSAPTDSVYDCRPYTSDNAETCTFATPTAGTYHVRLKAYAAFSGLSLVGSYTVDNGGAQTYTNATDYTIADNATINSPITVSGRTGNGSATTPVAVSIVHTYQGDLKVDLVAPDGTVHVLHNRTGGSEDNIVQTVSLNLSSAVLNGTWNLRVNDNASGDTGRIDSWSITF